MLQKEEAIKLRREALQKELTHYLDKLWKIFSWTSTILVSITGGVIALKFRADPGVLSINNRLSLAIAVVVLSIYAIAQLNQLLGFEIRTRNKLRDCDEQLGIAQALSMSAEPADRPDTHPMSKWIGYKATVFLLSLAAIYTVIFG